MSRQAGSYDSQASTQVRQAGRHDRQADGKTERCTETIYSVEVKKKAECDGDEIRTRVLGRASIFTVALLKLQSRQENQNIFTII